MFQGLSGLRAALLCLRRWRVAAASWMQGAGSGPEPSSTAQGCGPLWRGPSLVQEGPPPGAEEGLDLLQRPALGLRHAAAGEGQVHQAYGGEEEEGGLQAKGVLVGESARVTGSQRQLLAQLVLASLGCGAPSHYPSDTLGLPTARRKSSRFSRVFEALRGCRQPSSGAGPWD